MSSAGPSGRWPASWQAARIGDTGSAGRPWPHVRQLCRIERRRTNQRTGVTNLEVSYAITSLSPAKADAARLLALLRDYWGIENRLHYMSGTSPWAKTWPKSAVAPLPTPWPSAAISPSPSCAGPASPTSLKSSAPTPVAPVPPLPSSPATNSSDEKTLTNGQFAWQRNSEAGMIRMYVPSYGVEKW